MEVSKNVYVLRTHTYKGSIITLLNYCYRSEKAKKTVFNWAEISILSSTGMNASATVFQIAIKGELRGIGRIMLGFNPPSVLYNK